MAVGAGEQVPRRVWSSRIRSELVDWAEGYAERRGVSRSVIAEAAVEHFRGVCESGVPDLPEREAVPRRKRAVASAEAAKPGLAVASRSRLEELRAEAAGHAKRAREERERKYAERGW